MAAAHADFVAQLLAETARLHEASMPTAGPAAAAVDAMLKALRGGGRILACGNGGSATDAQHFAGELVGRFERERKAMAAIALTADTSILTALANDYDYRLVFARQVEALGRPGDVLIGISTSGRSRNVVEAFDAARRQGLTCIALTGGNGCEMLDLSDIAIVAPSSSTPRIQEVHIVALHLICELIDERMMALRSAPMPLTWEVFSKV
jgi:D-sedoheptulose 7-phosphate isomerase